MAYSRAAPTDGGFGWNLAYAGGQGSNSDYRQADVTWRTSLLETRAGLYGNRNDYTRWGEVSGSLVAMNGGVYATNTINDAFALVSTDGYAGIPVSYENQRIGVTNDKGYLLVPTVTSYYHAKFQIDPLNLPADVNLPAVEKPSPSAITAATWSNSPSSACPPPTWSWSMRKANRWPTAARWRCSAAINKATSGGMA